MAAGFEAIKESDASDIQVALVARLLPRERTLVHPGGRANSTGRAHRHVESNHGERSADAGNVAGADIKNEPEQRQRFMELVDRRGRDCIAGHLVCEKDPAKLAGKLDSTSGKRSLTVRHLERWARGIQG